MPGISEVSPSVLVTARSARGVNVSVSVAELLARFGSVVPPGAVTVAVLASVPVADAEMLAVSTNVAVPDGSRSTVVLMLPAPDAGQTEPADAVHVQLADDSAAGSVSATAAPTATDGPALETTIV